MNTDRYKGQIVLPEISLEGQKLLGGSRVAVVGLGGTGCLAAEFFSRMGTGTLVLIDGDKVRESNLHRQILYAESDEGEFKADAASTRLQEENSDLITVKHNAFLDDTNAAGFLKGCDLIYDGTDNLVARNVINRASVGMKIPWVMTSAIEYYGQVKGVIPGKTSCLSCLNYPDEGATLSCSEQGIFPPVLMWVTSIGVSVGIDILTGREVDGEFIHVDMKKIEMIRIKSLRDPGCSLCSHL